MYDFKTEINKLKKRVVHYSADTIKSLDLLIDLSDRAGVYRGLFNKRLINFYEEIINLVNDPVSEIFDYGLLGDKYSFGSLLTGDEVGVDFKQRKGVSYLMLFTGLLAKTIECHSDDEVVRSSLKRLLCMDLHVFFKVEVFNLSFADKFFLFIADDLMTTFDAEDDPREITEVLREEFYG